MRALILSLALASLLPLSAFAADNTSARRYGTSDALSVQNAGLGEVLMVRSVDIKSDKRLNGGSAIGAAVGYGAIVQADDSLIRIGDKVFLTGKGSKTRVVPVEGQR